VSVCTYLCACMPEQRPSPTSFSANLQFNMGGHIDEIPVQKLARINSQWGFGGVISPISLQFVCLYVSTLIVMQCLIKTEDIYIALLNTVIHLLVLVSDSWWNRCHAENNFDRYLQLSCVFLFGLVFFKPSVLLVMPTSNLVWPILWNWFQFLKCSRQFCWNWIGLWQMDHVCSKRAVVVA